MLADQNYQVSKLNQLLFQISEPQARQLLFALQQSNILSSNHNKYYPILSDFTNQLQFSLNIQDCLFSLEPITNLPSYLIERYLIVLDTGWIFAGNILEQDNRVELHNAIMLVNWNKCSFNEIISNPNKSNVTLQKVSSVIDFPKESEIFRVPIPHNWGENLQ